MFSFLLCSPRPVICGLTLIRATDLHKQRSREQLTEVDEFDLGLGCQENVVTFDITVYHMVCMQVVETLKYNNKLTDKSITEVQIIMASWARGPKFGGGGPRFSGRWAPTGPYFFGGERDIFCMKKNQERTTH